MPHEVFICYASHDKAVAEAVCTTLESRHIRCWIAPRDVLPGMEWAETIVDALDGSRVLVLVLSSSSNISPQVIREVGRAASNSTPIIPLRIDDVPLSKAMDYFISRHQWLDALTPPLKKHLQRLADTVQQILTREQVPPKGIEITEAEEVKKAKEAEERARKEAEKTFWWRSLNRKQRQIACSVIIVSPIIIAVSIFLIFYFMIGIGSTNREIPESNELVEEIEGSVAEETVEEAAAEEEVAPAEEVEPAEEEAAPAEEAKTIAVIVPQVEHSSLGLYRR